MKVLTTLKKQFSHVLTRVEMKEMKGGYMNEDLGVCTVTCPSGLYTCTSETGDCSDERHNNTSNGQVVAIICDGIKYNC